MKHCLKCLIYLLNRNKTYEVNNHFRQSILSKILCCTSSDKTPSLVIGILGHQQQSFSGLPSKTTTIDEILILLGSSHLL